MVYRTWIKALAGGIVGLIVGGLALGAAPAFGDEAYAKVDTVLSAAVTAHSVPGAIVLVRRHGKTVHRAAYGVSDGFELKPDSIAWVASMTKPIVATSVMILVDEGKVKLTDPVSKYIPEFSQPRNVRRVVKAGAAGAPPEYKLEPATAPITVRNLVTMTSGLQTIRVANAAIKPVGLGDTVASFTARLGDAPLDFQPGERWAYSNATGFDVLARVVEVASGEPWPAFAQHRVFDPLGMKDTSFGVRPEKAARTLPGGGSEALHTGAYPSGSAGVWSTVEDYSHLAQMLANGGVYEGRRLLKASTVKAMSKNEIGALSLGGVSPSQYGGLVETTNPAVKYGYGLEVIEDAKAAMISVPSGSFGWDGVGSRRFWVMPKLDLILVMVVTGGEYDALQRQIETAVVATAENTK